MGEKLFLTFSVLVANPKKTAANTRCENSDAQEKNREFRFEVLDKITVRTNSGRDPFFSELIERGFLKSVRLVYQVLGSTNFEMAVAPVVQLVISKPSDVGT